MQPDYRASARAVKRIIPNSRCDPSSSPNGLLRQYLPKSADLTQVAPGQLRAIVHALNRRPRKCLGFASPFEVFHAQPPG